MTGLNGRLARLEDAFEGLFGPGPLPSQEEVDAEERDAFQRWNRLAAAALHAFVLALQQDGAPDDVVEGLVGHEAARWRAGAARDWWPGPSVARIAAYLDDDAAMTNDLDALLSWTTVHGAPRWHWVRNGSTPEWQPGTLYPGALRAAAISLASEDAGALTRGRYVTAAAVVCWYARAHGAVYATLVSMAGEDTARELLALMSTPSSIRHGHPDR